MDDWQEGKGKIRNECIEEDVNVVLIENAVKKKSIEMV